MLKVILGYIRYLPLGAFIGAGLLVFLYCMYKDADRVRTATTNQLIDATLAAYLAAIIGARLFSVLANWQQLTKWKQLIDLGYAGFSIVGGLLAIALIMPIYLWTRRIPVLAGLDIAGRYSPLFQAIGRLGCLSVGCCYGFVHSHWTSIVYTGHSAGAPLGVPLCPTQLYSSLSLFGIFIFIYLLKKQLTIGTGSTFLLYLTLTSAERYANDFLRTSHANNLIVYHHTIYQIIALVTAVISFILLVVVSVRAKRKRGHL